jgi:hypothetical protein
MGQAHLEGLRGEPSQIVSAHSSEILAKQVFHPRVALPKDELGRLGDRTLDALPKLDDFKSLTEEQAHTMPEALFEGGLKLKTFEDKLEQQMRASSGNPQAIASEGALFYRNCSNQEQTPSSLRAVCYIHFVQLSVVSGHPENIPQNPMPPEVLKIAKAIIPSRS